MKSSFSIHTWLRETLIFKLSIIGSNVCVSIFCGHPDGIPTADPRQISLASRSGLYLPCTEKNWDDMQMQTEPATKLLTEVPAEIHSLRLRFECSSQLNRFGM